MLGYVLGGFFIGLIAGIVMVILAIILYFKKLKPKLEAFAIKAELNHIERENKK